MEQKNVHPTKMMKRMFSPKLATLYVALFLIFPVLSCKGSPSQEQPRRDSRPDMTADGVDRSRDTVQNLSADTLACLRDRVVFTPYDSTKVEELLSATPTGHDVLFYARQFRGIPYVAHTLEVSDPEKLVVNLRQLDCTTLVETAMALALTHRKGEKRFADYCRNLERIRYRHGRMDGYLSRLHYFTWWMHDNLRKGLISEVSDAEHFTAPIRVDNHYMSDHPDQYRMLRLHPQWTDSIRAMEKETNGPDGCYLPQESTGLDRRQLACVEDGDIVAIVTRKDGIDYSHLGFAVWHKDGCLHLLNASSIHHKVVEEPKTLKKYLSEHPSSIGIRLFRLNDIP